MPVLPIVDVQVISFRVPEGLGNPPMFDAQDRLLKAISSSPALQRVLMRVGCDVGLREAPARFVDEGPEQPQIILSSISFAHDRPS